MKKLLFALIVPAALFATTPEFVCVTNTPKTDIHVQFNFNEPMLGGSLTTRAQVQIYSVAPAEKHCAVFTISRMYKRIGYVQTYKGQLPNGAKISITEDSFQNEGPAHFVYGTYEANGVKGVPLTCTKSN